jgi:HEAT repeat protein
MALRLLRGVSCVLLLAAALPAAAQTAAPSSEPPEATEPAATRQASPKERAWHLLKSGVRVEKTDQRATAVGVLSLLRGQSAAIVMARKALNDDKPKVRIAAATALGELHATSAIAKLKEALSDKEPGVVLAAAHALVLMKDPSGYEVYYAILTGERKSGKGLVEGQMDTLRDPKKMAMLGFQEGIGFIPFAGIGYTAIRTIMKNDSSPVRAAAARVLADDHDPDTAAGLADAAVNDKSELVRVAALEAVARRGDPAYIGKIAPAMSDEKDPVRYTAAAAVVRLAAISERRAAKKK